MIIGFTAFLALLAAIVIPQFKQHPTGLAILFGTEMWERFSYYGGRALLILYMTAAVSGQNPGLEMSVGEAGALYALYVSGVYITNLPGGWISDKFLGARNAVFFGGVLIAAGNLLIGLTTAKSGFYTGLLFNCIGTGLLKPNVSTMVGSLYGKDDPRRDSAFSIFYMGINLGAFTAPLLAGYVGQKIDWNMGFVIVGIGMILGLFLFKWGGKYLGDAGLKSVKLQGDRASNSRTLSKALLGVIIGVAVLALLHFTHIYPITVTGLSDLMGIALIVVPFVYFFFLFTTGGFNGDEKKRIVAIIIFYLAAALFWGAFEQAGSTLTLFADRNTVNSIFGTEFPSTWWQSVNSMWILLLSPVFAILWLKLNKAGKEPSTPLKFTFGLLFAGLGFLILVPAAQKIAGGQERVGVMWLLITYFLHTVGELCLSPVGLSAMTKLAPVRIVGQMMGIWFLGASLGNWIGGRVGGLFEAYPLQQIFLYVFLSSAAAALIMFVLIPWTKRLMGEIK
ncbi:MAG: peptide MFS transporter [Saprospiraceae bacterium]|nr:peptide MFS transporter [Saprospiraceae bacterium]